MTEQYGQRNINDPAGARAAANIAGAIDIPLTAADVGKVLVLTSTIIGTVTLPSAVESGAGAEITVVVPTAAAFALTLQADAALVPAEALVVPAGSAALMSTANTSRTVRSDGGTNWYIVSGLA